MPGRSPFAHPLKEGYYMRPHNITYQTCLKRVSGAVAAGTTDTLTFTEVDCKGYRNARIIVVLGAVTATGTARLNAKGSDTSATYGAGTIDTYCPAANEPIGTTGDSQKILSLEIHRLRRRYLRAQLVRATANVAIECVIVELFNAEEVPAGAGDTTSTQTVLNNPVPSAT